MMQSTGNRELTGTRINCLNHDLSAVGTRARTGYDSPGKESRETSGSVESDHEETTLPIGQPVWWRGSPNKKVTTEIAE